MKIRRLVMLLLVWFTFLSVGIQVYAAENVIINDTTLSFNNVHYVDAVSGDDTNGDGSESNPYKTITYAYSVCTDGDALYLKGTFEQSDILSIEKDLTLIGDRGNTKIQSSKEWLKFTQPNKYLKLYRLIIEQTSGIRFVTTNSQPGIDIQIFNCVLSTPSEIITGIVYDYGSLDATITINNSYMDVAGGNLIRGYGETTTLTNCVIVNGTEGNVSHEKEPTVVTSIFDENKSIYTDYSINTNLINIGTGENPDGTQANIGVYGGKFAWSEWVSETLNLDIEAQNYEIQGGTEFETFAVIKAASNIYAEDINITYDTNLFELISAEPVDSTALKIYHEETETSGQARYVTASRGSENGLNGDAQILKLIFKAKNVNGSGDIAVASGLVADGDGLEITPICTGKTFTVSMQNSGDVNKDGKFTLGDLAIAGRLFESTSDTWGDYEPDVDLNGDVEDIDLTAIVQSILANENN